MCRQYVKGTLCPKYACKRVRLQEFVVVSTHFTPAVIFGREGSMSGR